ncbi:RDD family protein [Alkalibacillus haloalkaliphilus]|uniref:RDD family protein n=1 Tax=Alkalibacillus haloalkaliphilus TaxID=94136 RepID=UPI002935BF4E|nr:RDD family protein [Alkalibacillus haloalkaliphilus]MDV2581725.1 RDD family protein [Alkalibacillus haloalkaliphilus]
MRHTYSSFLERLIARILDFNILTFTIALIFFIVTGNFSIDWRNGITWDTIYILYLVITPVLWSGYVIGKRICKIKMKRIDGDDVTLGNTLLREVVGFHIVGIVTFGVSWIVSIFMVVFREDKRAIHDLIGGTYVGKA